MIILKNNQTTKILFFGKKAYSCLLENGKLAGYMVVPYLDVKGNFVVLNLSNINKDIEKLNRIDIIGKVRKTANADAFRENIVKPTINIQNIEFNIRNVSNFINSQNFSDDVVERINNFKNLADRYVRLNDDFVSQYSKNVPNTWAKDMFHGVDYTLNPTCLRESNVAKGFVNCDANSVMTTQEKINNMDPITKMRAIGTMYGLNEQIAKTSSSYVKDK